MLFRGQRRSLSWFPGPRVLLGWFSTLYDLILTRDNVVKPVSEPHKLLSWFRELHNNLSILFLTIPDVISTRDNVAKLVPVRTRCYSDKPYDKTDARRRRSLALRRRRATTIYGNRCRTALPRPAATPRAYNCIRFARRAPQNGEP